jgi:hypothetical protein
VALLAKYTKLVVYLLFISATRRAFGIGVMQTSKPQPVDWRIEGFDVIGLPVTQGV